MNQLLKKLLCVSLVMVFISVQAVAEDGHFEAYLDGLVAGQFHDYDLAGMTFVMVKDGEIALSKGYGLADLATGERVDPARHLFRPGSVSKLFTWTAVMQLVEAGKLDPHADVSQYIDQFEMPNEQGSPITLANIMSHTPGLEDGAAGYLFADEPADLIPLAEALAKYTPRQVRQPGTQAAYSNWATALAGLIVANISGMSFEAYVQTHIFEPLGMQQATFDEPLPSHLADDMATGYVESGGTLEPFGFEYIKNFGPAGALSAASNDMARFMIAHLNQGAYGDAHILKPETIAHMHSQHFTHSEVEGVAGMAHGFIESFRHGQRFIGHAGDTIAFHSSMTLDPENNFGFYMSFNAPDGATARGAIINGIIDYFYATHPVSWNYEEREGSAERIAEVVGAYRLNRRSYTKLEGIVSLAQDISVAPSGAGQILIPGPLGGKFAEVEDYVFEKVGDHQRLVFQKDASGAIAHLYLASLPIIVADRVGTFETAANHQLVILLALLAALFVLINYVRNRKDGLSGGAARGRASLVAVSVCLLVFVIGMGIVIGGLDMNRVVFDFPPPGIPLLLVFPILIALFTLIALVYLVPVWRADACSFWARIRYTYVCIVFVLLLAVMHYWNMIGWNYY